MSAKVVAASVVNASWFVTGRQIGMSIQKHKATEKEKIWEWKKQSVSQLRFRRQNKMRAIANWKRFPCVHNKSGSEIRWQNKTNQYEKCFSSF